MQIEKSFLFNLMSVEFVCVPVYHNHNLQTVCFEVATQPFAQIAYLTFLLFMLKTM